MDQPAVLLARLGAGDRQAFEALVREYRGRMLAIAQRFLACAEDGEDAVQEALLAAYRSLESFKGNSELWTWLYRVLVNACRMVRRSRSRHRMVSLEDVSHSGGEPGHGAIPSPRSTEPPHACAERTEMQAWVHDSIARLPEHYRQVLLLRDIDELNIDQTAQRLGTSRGAVKSRLHRARQALRARIAPRFRTSA
jgi:RNA polymerase sigma-70 factor (ECF subfamily)